MHACHTYTRIQIAYILYTYRVRPVVEPPVVTVGDILQFWKANREQPTFKEQLDAYMTA